MSFLQGKLEILNGSLDLAAGGILGRRTLFFARVFVKKGQSRSKWVKRGQNGGHNRLNGVKRGQRGHNGLKYCQTGHNSDHSGVNGVKMGSQCSKSSSRTQIVGNCHQIPRGGAADRINWRPLGRKGPNLGHKGA